jgi:hypothetical protein
MPVGLVLQEDLDPLLVFAGMHRAGGINETPPWRQQGGQAVQQSLLQGGELGHAGGSLPPACIGMASQGTQT